LLVEESLQRELSEPKPNTETPVGRALCSLEILYELHGKVGAFFLPFLLLVHLLPLSFPLLDKHNKWCNRLHIKGADLFQRRKNSRPISC